jgi:hypothetical protein
LLLQTDDPKDTAAADPAALIEEARQRCHRGGDASVLLEQDDHKTATGSDPEALIEEARQLQRQRTRQRTIVLQVVGLLIILGVGVNQFVRGGNSPSTAPKQPLTNAAQTPTVTYKKVVSQRFVPLLPVETYTMEIWSSSATPDVVRAIVTSPGGHRVEVGIVLKHDKVLGLEQVYYLFDAPTDTIYPIGSGLISPPPPPARQTLKQVLATPFARLEGTRTYQGRSAYVVVIRRPHDRVVTKQTLYLDKRTHEIVGSDLVATALRVLDRRIQQRTLPATKANLALTSLPTAHPGARIAREEPPRIQRLARGPFVIDSDAFFEMIMR